MKYLSIIVVPLLKRSLEATLWIDRGRTNKVELYSKCQHRGVKLLMLRMLRGLTQHPINGNVVLQRLELNAGTSNRAPSRLHRDDAIAQRSVAEGTLARGRSYAGPWSKLCWPVAEVMLARGRR